MDISHKWLLSVMEELSKPGKKNVKKHRCEASWLLNISTCVNSSIMDQQRVLWVGEWGGWKIISLESKNSSQGII